VGLYVARRGWARLAVRAAGWAVLTGCAAAAADYAAGWVAAPVSAFGKGGSVGAYLRVLLDDNLKPPLPGGALAAGTLLGLVLAADGLVRAVGRAAWLALRAVAEWAVRGNSLVARVNDRLIAGLQAVGRGLGGLFKRKKAEVVRLSPAGGSTKR